MPECPIGLEYVWLDYKILHNRRQAGFDINPFPPSEIVAMLDIRGYTDPEAREVYFDLICMLDDHWRSLYNKKPKKKKDKDGGA